ncbi:MAG: hypothetical protein R2932_29915 [Caldilineaceae bacterium]
MTYKQLQLNNGGGANLFDGVLTYNLYQTGFEGKLDEIRLYNSLLTDQAVATLYNTGIRALELTAKRRAKRVRR